MGIVGQWHRLLATFFYIGYAPVASGTVASAAGVGVVFLLKDHALMYLLVLVFFLVSGVFAANHMEKVAQKKDPGCVVIDEVAGMMIALMGLPWHPAIIIGGFFLFRAFDMFKIYPVNKFEAIAGGMGIMLDDVMAGVYTNLILHMAVRWVGII